ncbi:hypothetical protein BP6252_11325 [Coleophoma cylindrospora]|uniref:Nephrocystin 3-like N-terminal domain-containing protein n=1 Tax=Coleophoma cylindrospora TaxID=1849047 RepID=A0A3D8QQ61_9HELO|nr:hypothetical protein BP6252_11325 [Coleophoma cylindrospora]
MAPSTVAGPNVRSVDDLRNWLQPTEYLAPGSEYMKHLNSYVAGTGDWLRQAKGFCGWKDGKEKGCLWVRGLPGSGKSVFAASTVNILAQTRDNQGKEIPVLFFFFRQIVAKNHDPKYLVRDWVAQLLPFSGALRAKVHALSEEEGVEDTELTKLWEALVESLEEMEKVYCVADALDEMDDQQVSFIEKLTALGQHRPENIKVLLTSRPVPRVEITLRHVSVESLKLEALQIYPDIARYVTSRLSSLEPSLAKEKELLVQEAVCQRAAGLFLYARLTMDSLAEGLHNGTIVEDELPASLEALPSNLKELYTTILAEHSRRSGITQDQQFTILQCVTQSSRPLRLIELGSIIALLRKDTLGGLKEAKDLVREACGRLLEILDDESVTVIHHSFTEFARDETRRGEPGAFPVLEEHKAQRMLLQVFLQYLDSCVTLNGVEKTGDEASEEKSSGVDVETEEANLTEEDAKIEDEDSDDSDSIEYDSLDNRSGRSRADKKKHQEVQELRRIYPLIPYATDNLEYHIKQAESSDTNVFDLLDTYFTPGSRAFEVWLLVKWHQYRRGNVQPLHIAACLGLSGYAQHLIGSGSNINVQDAEDCTALVYAAEQGHADIVALLLSNGANTDSHDHDGDSPLHLAASRNRVDVTKLLLAAGMSPKRQKFRSTPELILEQLGDDSDQTPLQYACRCGHTQIITLFLEHIDDNDACRCLLWSVQSRKPEAVRVILKTGKAPVDVSVSGRTALAVAADLMEPDLMEVLLQHGADPNLRMEKERWYGEEDDANAEIKFKLQSKNGPTALHFLAGVKGNTSLWGDKEQGEKCIRLLVDAGADINAKAVGNNTALHYACKKRFLMFGEIGSTEEIMVELLLQYGADPNARCSLGATALHKMTPQRPNLVDILVRNGADINAKDNNGSTPILSIVSSIVSDWENTKASVTDKTLSKLLTLGADVAVENDGGWTVVHRMFSAIWKFKNEELWKEIIKAGADLNYRNKSGKTPLLCIKENEHSKPETEKLLQMLAEQGLELQSVDTLDETVLFKLFDQPWPSLASFQKLVSLGCTVLAKDQKGATLLHRCIAKGAPFEILEFLLNSGVDPLAVDENNNTLLHAFALLHPMSGFTSKLKRLIELGVPTDSQNTSGLTPLHIACATRTEGPKLSERNKDLLDLLLDGKLCPVSNFNALDQIGASPMHYAASFSEFNVGRLLRLGADPTLKTHEGLTPLHIAARGRQSNAIGLLLSELKKRDLLAQEIDQTDGSGRTALHYACRSGRPESVSYLLAAGASISVRDSLARTPLHALAEFPTENQLWNVRTDASKKFDAAGLTIEDQGRPFSPPALRARTSHAVRTRDIIELLEMAGCDIQATDRDGHTPVDVAIQTKCTELVNELRNRGISSQNLTVEPPVQKPEVIKEAAKLLERIDPSPIAGSKDVPPSKYHDRKFREILQRANYSLFDEFVKLGGDISARGDRQNETGLHTLVEWGYVGLLRRFVERVAGLEKEEDGNENPVTLLGHACKQALPRLEIIKVLVEECKVDVNRIVHQSAYVYRGGKCTALHILAAGYYFWNIEALGYLLDQEADIEAKNDRGETPLMVAVGSDYPNGFWKEETIRILLKRGADPNVCNDDGMTCLNLSDHANVTRILLSYGANILVGKCSGLTSAVQAMDTNAAKVLLDAGADPNKDHLLYKAGRPNDGYQDEDDSMRDQVQRKMISLLLEHGADPFAYHDDGFSIIQKLIEEHGILDLFWEIPDFPVELRGHGGRTPLISACFPTVTPAPKTYGCNKDKQTAVCFPEAALTLIRKGANVNAKDDLGRTPLHWICKMPEELDEAHQVLFKALLDSSPDMMRQPDNQGFTPFQLAISNEHTHHWITSYFISHGIDPIAPDPAGNTALHYLAPQLVGEKTKALAAAERFKYFLSMGLPINHRNDLCETALFQFICTSWEGTRDPAGIEGFPTYGVKNDISHVKALKLFTDAGADLQTQNKEGENLLHATAKRWRNKQYVEGDQRVDMLGIFQELMARGLDPRAEDAECRTAIDVAVASEHSFLILLFGPIERGATQE